MMRLLALLMAGAALTACAAGANYQQPGLPPPSSWSVFKDGVKNPRLTPADPAQLNRWWMQFSDPVLDQIVERAVAGNLDRLRGDLETADQRLRRAVRQNPLAALCAAILTGYLFGRLARRS